MSESLANRRTVVDIPKTDQDVRLYFWIASLSYHSRII